MLASAVENDSIIVELLDVAHSGKGAVSFPMPFLDEGLCNLIEWAVECVTELEWDVLVLAFRSVETSVDVRHYYFYKLNLINSATGYKSAQLVGTVSPEGNENLAVFSSIVHLGSKPALIGMILRPTTVPRHTYSNIKATGIFTLNAITKKQIKDAHHTSAKYPEEISEFDKTDLKIEKKGERRFPWLILRKTK